MKYKVGDNVKTTGSIRVSGNIINIIIPGKVGDNGLNKIGMPWDDETPHYVIEDEKSGFLVTSHPKNMEIINETL